MRTIKNISSIIFIHILFNSTMTLYATDLSNSFNTLSEDISNDKNEFFLFLVEGLNIDSVELINSQVYTVYFTNTPVENFDKSALNQFRLIEILHQKAILIHLYSLQNIDINFPKSDIIFPFHYFL